MAAHRSFPASEGVSAKRQSGWPALVCLALGMVA